MINIMRNFTCIRKLRTLATKRYSTTTIDTNEIQHFKQFASKWWDDFGPMMPLHSMNNLRIPLIRDGLTNLGVIPKEMKDSPRPLQGISILDVGCGGGILVEPLSRLGADVTGLDASADLVSIAKTHANDEHLNITFEVTSIEDYAKANAEKFDALVTSETLEHITHKEEFLSACVKCLKPNGSLFITTMNKTLLTSIFGIFLAEKVTKLLPEGTHDYEKLLEPHKLQRMLDEQNCNTLLMHGMLYNPCTNTWCWSSDKSINYALHAVKRNTIKS